MASTSFALSTGLTSSVRSAAPARNPRARMVVTCAKKKSGFGQTGTLAKQGKKQGKEKSPIRFLTNLDEEAATTGGFKGVIADGWNKIADLNELEAKNPLAIILASGKGVILWKIDDAIYCTDVESTAFRYPLIDGEIFDGPSGKAIRCGLDGTEYDLATGKVLKWCPKDTMVRKFLGTIKSNVEQIPLNVYPIAMNDDEELFTNLVA